MLMVDIGGDKYEYHFTGEDKNVLAADNAAREAFKYIASEYERTTDLMKKRAWKKVAFDTNTFLKTSCLADAGLILSRKSKIAQEGLTEEFQRVYERYRIVDFVIKDFPIKRENPIKANNRRDYSKTVDDVRFFFYVSGMDDKGTKNAFLLLSPLYDEMKERFSLDHDIRWAYLSEGIREVLNKNNLLAKNVTENAELFSKKHMRHLMNELRKKDEHPVLIDEDEDFQIVAGSEVDDESEELPSYDFSDEEDRALKYSGGLFDKYFKQK